VASAKKEKKKSYKCGASSEHIKALRYPWIEYITLFISVTETYGCQFNLQFKFFQQV